MTELFYRAAGAVLAPFRYAEREVEHMKEVAKEDLQAFMAKAIKMAIMGMAALFFLLFISIMSAALINHAMDSEVAGWAIVAGFYLVVAGIVYALKDSADNKKKSANHRPVNTRKPIGT
jgi:hypothetical protein